MFIDVTRFGAIRTLRLAVAAICYFDVHTDGTVMRLMSGESLHVEETIAELEQLIAAVTEVAQCASFDEPAPVAEATPPPAPAPPPPAPTAAPAPHQRNRGKRR